MLTGALRAVLEPLVEACRLSAKLPPRNLHRTVAAILWRHVAQHPGGAWAVVEGGADLHPLVAPRRLGASTQTIADCVHS
jgi:hypothetical protein